MAEDKTFYANDGNRFSSLKAFAKALKSMPSHVYEHHVNTDKNDFAAWIKFSMKNEKLSERIEGQIDKLEMELEVLRHLVHEAQKNNTNVKKAAEKKIKKAENSKFKSTQTKKEAATAA